MHYESKFKNFFRRLGLGISILLIGCGIFLTLLPMQEFSAGIGNFLMLTDKQVVYHDTPIIIPDFIPYSQIETYLKYQPYTPEHIKMTAFYCPNHEKISHREGYCDLCDPQAVLTRYEKGLHAPKDFFRNLFKSIPLKSEDGQTIIVQQIR